MQNSIKKVIQKTQALPGTARQKPCGLVRFPKKETNKTDGWFQLHSSGSWAVGRTIIIRYRRPRARSIQTRPFFQLEALEAIENEDVLVTAPTGSGKTWIAREEIRRLLFSGKRAWYTTPLKALTNSKYTEFCAEFGSEKSAFLQVTVRKTLRHR